MRIVNSLYGMMRDAPSSKYVLCIVHHPHILNDTLQALYKRQMRGIFFQVILPILLILEMAHKAM